MAIDDCRLTVDDFSLWTPLHREVAVGLRVPIVNRQSSIENRKSSIPAVLNAQREQLFAQA
jgi:hypothetical protein